MQLRSPGSSVSTPQSRAVPCSQWRLPMQPTMSGWITPTLQMRMIVQGGMSRKPHALGVNEVTMGGHETMRFVKVDKSAEWLMQAVLGEVRRGSAAHNPHRDDEGQTAPIWKHSRSCGCRGRTCVS